MGAVLDSGAAGRAASVGSRRPSIGVQSDGGARVGWFLDGADCVALGEQLHDGKIGKCGHRGLPLGAQES